MYLVEQSLAYICQKEIRVINKKSINKVILVGHVGNSPEVRFSKEGTCFASFSLATHELRKGDEEHTEWHNILALGKFGEFAENYIKKGQMICVEGKLSTKKWKTKEGSLRNSTEIVANNLIPLDWKD